MRLRVWGLLACLILPLPALADDAAPATDVFSYSTVEVDHLRQHSDYFGDSSSGYGLRAAYDPDGALYLFAQWDKLNFVKVGSHSVVGGGIGAHQAYNGNTSFYIDLAFLQDKLSSSLNSATDDYWRISYGLRSRVSSLFEVDAGIFTERNTVFGRRPFGERLGAGLDLGPVSLLGAAEHTANGNRIEFSLVWAYQ